MDGIRGVLLDLDGVIYQREAPISGAAETVEWLERSGIPSLFVTNTTSIPRRAIAGKLRRFGIDAEESRILTPTVAAARWLSSRITGVDGAVALFVPEGVRADFAGLPILPDDSERGASFVVIGDLAHSWSFATLNRAFRLLHAEPGATLVALGMTRFYLADDGLCLDVAPFVKALEHASDREAVVLGKPSPAFFLTAAGLLGLTPESILMVGDDIRSDVAGAQGAGLSAALVRTGKFRESDLEGDIVPEIVLESIASLREAWGEDRGGEGYAR